MAKFHLGWLKDKTGEKFAPKTFLSQILNNDGSLFQKRVENIEAKLKDHTSKLTNLNNNNGNLENVIEENTKNISSLDKQVTDLRSHFTPSQIILKDTVTGYDYVIEMRNGNLVSYIKGTSIHIAKLPDKTSGIFDPAGMIVTTNTVDGSIVEITNYRISDVVDGAVTVEYAVGNSVYSTIFHTYMTPVKDALIDFDYIINENGSYVITGWKGTLNGSPSTEMIVPDSSLIIMEVV